MTTRKLVFCTTISSSGGSTLLGSDHSNQDVPKRRHIIQGPGNAGTAAHYGPEWFLDQTRPGAIQARKEMEEFHRSLSAAQAIQVAQEAIMISSDYKTHLFTYRHGGAEWTLEIKARDIHDAKERLKALPLAHYDGELITKVPTNLGPLMQLVVWLRNVLRSLVDQPQAKGFHF